MAPTPKERAVHLSEAGLSAQTVAAILGVDLADVKSLMTEAEPDVELASGGGLYAPGPRGVRVDPEGINNQIPTGDDVTTWDDLAHLTAPNDAPIYTFEAQIRLDYRNASPKAAGFEIHATDPETFFSWWNGPSPSLIPYYWSAYLSTQGTETDELVTVNTAAALIVAGGTEIGMFSEGVGTLDSRAILTNAFWVPWVPVG